jgi:hypothetical protein
MTATETALQALAAVLVHAALPVLRRDVVYDDVLESFTSGTETALVLRRATNPRVLNEFMGAGLRFEIEHPAELEWIVSSDDASALQQVFDNGLAQIAAQLRLDPTLGGAVASCVLREAPAFETESFDGSVVLSAAITIHLTFLSTEPF